MTIRKGEDWGSEIVIPEGIVVAADDEALFSHLNSGVIPASIAVLSGDLARTVSSSADSSRYRHGERAIGAPLDLLEVTHDGGVHCAASHVVARRSWLRGPVIVVANAQFIGEWDVAPRSHPNDGYMDITEVDESMSPGQRLLARRRLPTATHLPHPGLRTLRSREQSWDFAKSLDLFVDGVRIGRTRRLAVRVLADATSIIF